MAPALERRKERILTTLTLWSADAMGIPSGGRGGGAGTERDLYLSGCGTWCSLSDFSDRRRFPRVSFVRLFANAFRGSHTAAKASSANWNLSRIGKTRGLNAVAQRAGLSSTDRHSRRSIRHTPRRWRRHAPRGNPRPPDRDSLHRFPANPPRIPSPFATGDPFVSPFAIKCGKLKSLFLLRVSESKVFPPSAPAYVSFTFSLLPSSLLPLSCFPSSFILHHPSFLSPPALRTDRVRHYAV